MKYLTEHKIFSKLLDMDSESQRNNISAIYTVYRIFITY